MQLVPSEQLTRVDDLQILQIQLGKLRGDNLKLDRSKFIPKWAEL